MKVLTFSPTGLVELSGTTVTKMTDFQALADAVASVNANASTNTVSKASYTPSNTARQCPAVAANVWLASDILPPTPNTTICENMVAASSCVPSASLSANDTASLFGTVCGLSASACDGITANATSGKYGAYVMCNATQQLTNALNAYYVAQKSVASACSFGGKANVVKPSASLLPAPASSSSGGSSSVSTNSTSSPSAGGSGGAKVSAGSASSNNSSSSSSKAGGAGTSSGSTSGSTTTTGSTTVALGTSPNVTSANNSTPTQSSSSSQNGASRTTGVVLSAGWAGSLLAVVGAAMVFAL